MPSAADIEKKSVQAALKLAAKSPWSGMTLRDISDAAGFSLAELYPPLPGVGESYLVRPVRRAIIDDDYLLVRIVGL